MIVLISLTTKLVMTIKFPWLSLDVTFSWTI